MITTEKALEIILNHTEDLGIEEINFKDSLGMVLKEDILADRDFPPFHRASMDGIAITTDAFNSGKRAFKIEGVQAAGSEQLSLKDPENCIEVMTGAMAPVNSDAVIPYELVEITEGIARVSINDIQYFQNIHRKGLDRKEKDLLIAKNTVISAAEIGVLTTVGKTTVKVARNPKVMIISTGDELVEVDQKPEAYQIRRSNVHTLVALLERIKIDADSIHIADDKPLLKQKIKAILENYDVLLFSGAVSKGKFDFLPEVLEELGVEKLFHKVRQRPGKPFWFGKKDSTTIFAFPGNPVSTFVSCMKYFYPWVKKSAGIGFENNDFAILAKSFTFKPDLTYFLQVKLENKNGQILAHPVAGHGSGDLANLVDNDAFLELPRGNTLFNQGEVFPLIRYRGN
ncbi:MAG: molybdopterin molybdenumtransferase MoeA [Flavobacteriia bacterium]|nr:MAG: molybdopterin molybdenumtransferase MoeA [Flavobacteriia bacterium]